ncbi:putative mitochondrial protein [Tanacetum coccineum]
MQSMNGKIATIETGQAYLSNEVTRFRNVDNVSDVEKVRLASIHLYDKALAWHRQFEKIHGELVTWELYETEIYKRFGPCYEDPMEEIKNLSQSGTVPEYQDKFEALISRVELTESQAISCFVGGLQQDIGLMVKMFRPKSLYDAFQLARMQESVKAANSKRYTLILPTPKHPVNTVIANRSTNYLQIHLLTQLALPSTSLIVCYAEIHHKGDVTKEYEEKKGRQDILILVDSGSTHNFVDVLCAKKLGFEYKRWSSNKFEVPVGNKITLRGTQQATLQWMNGKDYGKVLSSNKMSLSAMSLCVYPSTLMVVTLDKEQSSHSSEHSQALATLLETKFQDVFAIPNTLPPHRSHDHKIILQEGAPPVNIRPYKHPPTQKDAIELMVKELLETRVIRHSHSPFSSPIVMVKKKDGTWRMCMDYRKLNQYTVKDKFPIPVIEELIDELNGATIFSKLDLRAGYHQIRMADEDIHKTAFRTHEGHYEFLVMPFGLTNAPSTFQALMNAVFKDYLRHFVLVFFDDILIYSDSMKSHLTHLATVLQVMRSHTLFAKQSKCVFAVDQVEYLGHVLSAKGVATDPSKIEAMKSWPVPKNIKELRGFLGLTGYYRRFIKGYAILSQPLTSLLRKNAYQWSDAAQTAFDTLKKAMTQSPVLALPNFKTEFVVETDASGIGLGAVLQQGGHPIAYLSKTLVPKHQSLSTYEKELMAIILALEKWRGYLLDRHFKIKTDHFSLKYLLDQRLSTPFQTKWLPKLLGYDYEIIYKKGADNAAADALSRLSTSVEFNSLLMSSIEPELLNKIKASWQTDVDVQLLIQKLETQAMPNTKFSWEKGELRRKGKLVIGNDAALRAQLVAIFHQEPVGGHSGIQVSLKKLASLFYWKGMSKAVKMFVRECDVCQRNKPNLEAYPGFLQPLPIPEHVWKDISMDFIDGLPSSQGKTVIFVIVDRLSKYAHFVALSHPYTAPQVAQAFLDHAYKLHGLLQTIVSDRDRVERPKEWTKWLSLAEYWYNTNFHTSINTTPFEVVYGQPPTFHVPYVVGTSSVDKVDRTLAAREEAINVLKFHLRRAQDRMKAITDGHRTYRHYAVGDMVYLKLQPYRQISVRQGVQHKLSSKFFGPFEIISKVGEVAYNLQLPDTAKVHPVFHVSQLKRCKSKEISMGTFPTCNEEGLIVVEPFKILDRRLQKKGNAATVYVLVQWANGTADDATWEWIEDLQRRFPQFLADA